MLIVITCLSHFIHAIYAAYALGAQPKTIQRIADAIASYQQPLRPVEKGTPINQSNWNDKHLLGKRDNYPTYLNYFREEVDKTKDTASLLDKYIYSRIANEVGVDVGFTSLALFVLTTFRCFLDFLVV